MASKTRPAYDFSKATLVGIGTYADVLRIAEDRVLKSPKIYPEHDSDMAYSNYINRWELENEKAIYERLGEHDGIIRSFKAVDGFLELAFANQGDLEKYIRTNPSPSRTARANWIQLLVDAFSYVHSRRVVIHDIALRNILVHDNALKLCDFGDSSLLPLETNMHTFCESDTTPQVEMIHVGCILFSIAIWQVFKYDDQFSELKELSVTNSFCKRYKKVLERRIL